MLVLALIVAALAPQAVAATPPSAATERLLEAVEGSPESGFVLRGSTSQRSLLTYTSASTAAPLTTEQLLGGGYAAPPSVTMSATLEYIPAAPVARPAGPATITGNRDLVLLHDELGDQAVVALPVALGGHYYPPPGGGTVVVCADRCATFPIGDACGCHWGEAGQKVVDLSPGAWAAITDKDRHVYGVLTVTLYLN